MKRVAIVHDWLTGMRGGERVLEGTLQLYPDAEIFTLVHAPGSVSRLIEDRPIHASFLRHAPGIPRRYRWYLPLFPLAVEAMRIRGFDLVLSSSHCVAKGARTDGAPHLCYCHTPMRYAWEQLDAYFTGARARLLRPAAAAAAAALRHWDVASAGRVDAFVANSVNVRERIRRCYGLDATVVHPPVDVDRFRAARGPEEFYLVIGALVPYKRVDLAVRACALLGRRLVVAGDGPELARLRRIAGPHATFLGRVGDDDVADLYSRCRALLFPGIEDFGITAVEAQAAGAPVVARGAGGALESVTDGITGVFFDSPTPESLAAAMLRLESTSFDETTLRRSARRFEPSRFLHGLRAAIAELEGGAVDTRTAKAFTAEHAEHAESNVTGFGERSRPDRAEMPV